MEFINYYMLVTLAVRERANCKGKKVGAIIVKNNRIIGTGYNGTPEDMKNCEDGGCVRCEKYRNAGELYDKCICVHAEQNALVSAARFGHGIENSIMYTTLQPCFSCLKELLQAKVETIYYLYDLLPTTPKDEKEKDFLDQYHILLNAFKRRPSKINHTAIFQDAENLLKNLKEGK